MTMLNWPDHLDRTPEEDRETNNKFSVGFSRTRSELQTELENRMQVDEWRLDDVSGSSGDPGVVVRWTKNGREHAVACDYYTTKGANLRAAYLYLKETRMAGERPVKTGEDQFAAAALPGEVDEAVAARPPPHEILGVQPDAEEEVVRAVYEKLEKKHHPDTGDGDKERLADVRWAKEQLLG